MSNRKEYLHVHRKERLSDITIIALYYIVMVLLLLALVAGQKQGYPQVNMLP